MNRFCIEAAAITHIGSGKESNDGNYYINGKYKSDSNISTDGIADKKPRNVYTYAVCDGLGADSYGELASLLAVATLEKFKDTDIRMTISSYVKMVNEYISDLIQKGKQIESGTTLALLSVRENTALAYCIGSSRAYFCRKGYLYLISDNLEQVQDNDVHGHYLGHFSPDKNSQLRVSEEIKGKKGDVFLLCTRGLTDALSDDELVEILSDNQNSAIDMTKMMVSQAHEKGGKDDITVIAAKLV